MRNYFLGKKLVYKLRLTHRTTLWSKRGIIFVHIPKAAGSSVNEALYGRFMGHMSADEIRRFAPRTFARLPSFSITRNPWDRLVSAYRFARKGRGEGGAVTAAIHNPEQYDIPAFRSFGSFVEEWLEQQDLAKADYVFQPQLPFVSDARGNILVSHLGKVERLSDTESYLEHVLGSPVKISQGNASGPPTDYRSWYNATTQSIVAERYSDDIAAFGYDF